MRAFLIAFVVGISGLVLGAHLFPLGELVGLRTLDEEGRPHDSTLWVMDGLNGVVYLRAGRSGASWLDRAILHPLVELERHGERRFYRAEPVEDEALRRALNAKLARKYGVADALVRFFGDVEHAVVVRLDPLAGEGTPAPGARGPHGPHP